MPYFNEGKFRARIELAQLSESKNNKTPQVELHLKLLAEVGDGGEEFEPPKTRFMPIVYLSITEGTMRNGNEPGWVANVLKHIGFKGDFARLGEVEGWEGHVWCAHKEDQNGELRDRWEIDMPRAPQIKQQDRSQARKLNSTFGGLFKASDLERKPRKAKASPGETTHQDGDGVPTDDIKGAMDLRDDEPEGSVAQPEEIPF